MAGISGYIKENWLLLLSCVAFCLFPFILAVVASFDTLGLQKMGYGDWISIAFVAVTILGSLLMCGLKQPAFFICNFASTLGVLGTFVGIFIGLLDFDVADIQSSIPPLLEGLKTAFITSIVGMVCALFVRLLYRRKEGVHAEIAPTKVEDVKNTMYLSQILLSLDEIKDFLRGEFVEVLKTMDKTHKDNILLLDGRIQEFGKIVAEQSSKELIGAIQKVMEDFNAKINDQLGQSFNDLTESCKNLNKWQQEHVELLKEMELYNKKVLDYLIASDGFLAKFDETQNLYIKNSEELRNEIMYLGRFITRITELGEKFDKTMPLIEIRMDENTQRISDIIKVFNVQAKNVLESQTEMNGKMNNAMQAFSNHLVGVLQNFHNRITEVQNNRFR